MTSSVSVYVSAGDRLIEYGLRAQLEDSPGDQIRLLSQPSRADVSIVATQELADVPPRVRQLLDVGCRSVLVISPNVEMQTLAPVVAAGACGVLRSADASPRRLREVILAVASGGGTIPYDLVGQLLTSSSCGFHRLRNLGENIGLSNREELVLRLLADGMGTLEIAEELHYSERTIKTVVHSVIRRFGLRNRPHAVAFALRRGLIQ